VITCDVLGYHPGTNNGLGNQMFCIAATLGLAHKNGTFAVFPDLKTEPYKFYGETIFYSLRKGGNKNFTTNVYQEPLYTSTIYNEIPFVNGMKISGHFQSYKYFDFCRDLIVDSFKPPESMIKEINEKYKDVIALDAVSMHIRRGDYISLADSYEILDVGYYKTALHMMGEVQKIIVFSDDIPWCKDTFAFLPEDKIFYVEGEEDVRDLYLMSKIRNNIISNSTFSWWAAYLNNNENKKVIGPRKWFGPKRTKNNDVETKDLFPPGWIRI